MLKLERERESGAAATASAGWATPARVPGEGLEPSLSPLSHLRLNLSFSLVLLASPLPGSLYGSAEQVPEDLVPHVLVGDLGVVGLLARVLHRLGELVDPVEEFLDARRR